MHIYEGKIILEDKIGSSDLIKDYNHSKSVYEVIRIINGKPLFLKDHLKRLYASCDKKEIHINEKNNHLIQKIEKVITINDYKNKNIKIQLVEMNQKAIVIIGFIKSSYIEESFRLKGIHTILYKGDRLDPNVKQQDDLFRKIIAHSLNEFQATEALLVNKDNEITEGSRSNVFFVKENKIYTAPSRMVLKGITREKVFAICKQQNIDLMEIPVNTEKLNNYDAVFLTGTSIDILPVASINQYLFQSIHNHIVEKIQNEYNRCKEMYLNNIL
ncbi:MAG: aminotransferase class IV [Clostridia bacterium]|nr:aminotransferase class IV [Clostridia bacterium]